MRVIDVGMQQTDGDAFIRRVRQFVRQRHHRRPIQRDQHAARRLHPFAHHVAAVTWQQGGGQHEVQVVLFEPAFGPHFDHVAKALGRDQRRLCPPPFDERVGGQGRAVNDLGDGARCHACLGANAVQAVDDRLLRRSMGRQHLGRDHPAFGFKHEIGKCTADIDTEPIGLRSHTAPAVCIGPRLPGRIELATAMAVPGRLEMHPPCSVPPGWDDAAPARRPRTSGPIVYVLSTARSLAVIASGSVSWVKLAANCPLGFMR